MKLAHIALTVLISSCIANADTLFNNFSAASGHDDYVTANGHAGPLAASFSTGNVSLSLDSVALSLLSVDPSDGGMITVTLNGDSGTSPGTSLYMLGTVNDSSLTTTNSEYDLSVSGVTLAANSRYWIELTDNIGTSSMRWEYAIDNSGIGAANEFYFYGGNVFPDADGGYIMALTGTSGVSAIPEPATFAVTLVGLGLVAGWKRKRFGV